MKKILFLFILVLLSSCTKQESTTLPNSPTSTTTPTTTNDSSITSSISDFLGLSSSKKCTLKNNPDNKIQSVYYISGTGKVRANMKFVGEGLNDKKTDVEMNTLVDKDNMYYWTEKPTPFGFKMSMEKIKNMANQQVSGMQNTPNITAKDVFNCQPWQLDNSLFVVPTNITFQSL